MNAFDQYKAEVQKKWGNTEAYRQHAKKTKEYPKEKWDNLAADMDQIMADFALCMQQGEPANSEQAQSLVKALQNHITEHYYHCTDQILAGLGQMYVADERFQRNIDKHAPGTAAFVCEAITAYCSKS